MSSDKQQMSEDVRMHKRIAMGEKLDGTSLASKGKNTSLTSSSHSKGGLHHAKKK